MQRIVLALPIFKALSCSGHMNRLTSAVKLILFQLKALTLRASFGGSVLWSEISVKSYLALQALPVREGIFGRVCLLSLKSLTQH